MARRACGTKTPFQRELHAPVVLKSPPQEECAPCVDHGITLWQPGWATQQLSTQSSVPLLLSFVYWQRKKGLCFLQHLCGGDSLPIYIPLSSTSWDTRDNLACFWYKADYNERYLPRLLQPPCIAATTWRGSPLIYPQKYKNSGWTRSWKDMETTLLLRRQYQLPLQHSW